MLILPLEFHAPQRSRREIPRFHTHHQGAVGQARIPFEGLMPLTTRPPCSEAEATTWPPGHMQKEYTARPVSLSWKIKA